MLRSLKMHVYESKRSITTKWQAIHSSYLVCIKSKGHNNGSTVWRIRSEHTRMVRDISSIVCKNREIQYHWISFKCKYIRVPCYVSKPQIRNSLNFKDLSNKHFLFQFKNDFFLLFQNFKRISENVITESWRNTY